MCASGWLGNQSGCWSNNKSPPRKGSRRGELKWRSEINNKESRNEINSKTISNKNKTKEIKLKTINK